MYYLLVVGMLASDALAGGLPEVALASRTVLSPGSCETTHADPRQVLECLWANGTPISMELSGGREYRSPGAMEILWESESVDVVLQRANERYPGLGLQVLDVGDRLFLAGDTCFATEFVLLPQTTYPDGMAAMEAILENFQPDGMPISLMQPLNFHDMVQNPRPITFRTSEASMLEMMDQWLDTYIPVGARWQMRCNIDRRACTFTVIRSFSTALRKDWADTAP